MDVKTDESLNNESIHIGSIDKSLLMKTRLGHMSVWMTKSVDSGN